MLEYRRAWGGKSALTTACTRSSTAVPSLCRLPRLAIFGGGAAAAVGRSAFGVGWLRRRWRWPVWCSCSLRLHATAEAQVAGRWAQRQAQRVALARPCLSRAWYLVPASERRRRRREPPRAAPRRLRLLLSGVRVCNDGATDAHGPAGGRGTGTDRGGRGRGAGFEKDQDQRSQQQQQSAGGGGWGRAWLVTRKHQTTGGTKHKAPCAY
jgi:hypothetical protein